MPYLPTAFLSQTLPDMAGNGKNPLRSALSTWAQDCAPRAVLVASSCWRPDLPTFSGARRPGLCRDFPHPLGLLPEFDPLGDPALALDAIQLLSEADLKGHIDTHHPLSPGAWIPLQALFPGGEIPLVELGLPAHWSPEDISRLGLALSPLRGKGVLILGCGCMEGPQDEDPARIGTPWAVAFDRWLESSLRLGQVIAGTPEGQRRSSPPPHLLAPLFFAWGASDGGAARALGEALAVGPAGLPSLVFAA